MQDCFGLFTNHSERIAFGTSENGSTKILVFLFVSFLHSDLFFYINKTSQITKTIEAAIDADLNPFEMGPLEKTIFPSFVSNPNPYLQVRNHILGKFYADVTKYISLKDAEKGLKVTKT